MLLAALAVLVVLGTAYLAFGETRASGEVVLGSAKPREPLPSSRIDLHVTPVSVDSLHNQVEVEVYPVLVGDVGRALGTASLASKAFTLFFDGGEPAEQRIAAGDAIDKFDARVWIDERRPRTVFPFDTYTGELVASAWQGESPGTGSPPVPVVIWPEPPGVENFNMRFSVPAGFSPAAGLDTGLWRTSLSLQRDADVRFVTLIVGLVLICSALAVSSVALTIVIGRRKPSTDMLAWMAVFPFALITLRGVIPGAPPVGVDFDVGAYYWTIAIAFMSLIACVGRWLATRGAE